MRYEVISAASDEPCELGFGIWQERINPPEGEKDYSEIMANGIQLNGPGSIGYANSSPVDWWESYEGVDFSRVQDFIQLGLIIWSLSPRSVIAPKSWGGNNSVWNNRDVWFPISVKATVIAVAEGYTFSGWEHYEDMITSTGDHEIEIESLKNDESPYPFTVHFDQKPGYITLDFAGNSVFYCNIIDLQGHVMYTGNITGGKNSIEISLSSLRKELYILHVVTNNKLYNYKFIPY
jgi:hypothetical protein